MRVQLRIVGDDNSVISEDEIMHLDKGDDRLGAIGLSFDEARTMLAGIQKRVVSTQEASFLGVRLLTLRFVTLPAITNFPPGTRRSSHKGPSPGRGYLTAICRKRITISKNLIRLLATGSRSPARTHHKGGPPVRWMRSVLPAHGTRPAVANAGDTMWSAAEPGRRHHGS
jgi:hypothetical protein